MDTFLFADAALPPRYLDEFATKIIKQRIKIYFFMQNRLENAFDETLLKKLYKAGLRVCGWGLESASPKVLKKMNKGINIDSAQKILETAHSLGIFNRVNWIYNFPGETIDDFNLTYNFIKRNVKYAENHSSNRFMLPTFSYMYSNPKKFGLDEKLIKQAENNHKDCDCLYSEWLGIPIKPEVQKKVFEIQSLIMQKKKIITTGSEMITTLTKYNKNGD